LFRILKFFVGLAALGAFVWVGANVPLGSHTLFEHLQAIGKTRETQDLLEGTRQSAKPLMDGVRDGMRKRLAGEAAAHADAGVAPAEEISAADRQRLRKLLDDHHASR